MMLTTQQLLKLNDMVSNYRKGLRRTLKLPENLIDGWSKRYRIAMERVLQRQCKR